MEHQDGPAPQRGPLPGFHRTVTSVTLELPGSGAITVTSEAIVVRGPDDLARRQVVAQLGNWARGQWFRAQGLTVLNGTCIERDGTTIVFTGPPRTGCSLLALVLVNRGWSLTSDGIVAWGPDGVPLVVDEAITVDRSVVRGIHPDRLATVASGRDRVSVRADSVATGPIGGSVVLGRRMALTDAQVISSEGSNPIAERLSSTPIPALVPGSPIAEEHIPSAPGLRLLRPISSDEAVVRRSAPPVLADLIEETLRGFCA